MERIWKPNATVAAIIECDGKFLLVEEETDEGVRYNQPAGHLDDGESLPDACAREALEETAWHFMPTELVGIYQWGPASKPELTYLRFAFAGTLGDFEQGRPQDAYLRLSASPDTEVDSALQRQVWEKLLAMYRGWAKARRMQLGVLAHDPARLSAVLAVSGFGAYSILQREQGCSLEEATRRVAEMHDDEVRAFVALEAALPSWGEPLDTEVRRYVDVLRCWMRANRDWSIDSERYRSAPRRDAVTIEAAPR